MRALSRYLVGLNPLPLMAGRTVAQSSDDRRATSRLLPGQTVEVRPAAEIIASLDADFTCEGLPFMPEMLKFCGRRMVVHRRANRTCVEGHGVRTMRDAVLLAGGQCDGAAHDGCQRECLLFWKEAWLKPVADPASPPLAHHPSSQVGVHLMLSARTRQGTRYLCQSSALHGATQPLSRFNVIKYVQEIADGELSPRGFLQIVARVLVNRLRALAGAPPVGAVRGPRGPHAKGDLGLQAGECVRVRAIGDISRTVGPSGRNRGLLFEPDMAAYAGRGFKVEGRIEKIISEQTGEMVHLTSTVALKNVRCEGLSAKNCPRAQAHFWREAWLDRVDPAAPPTGETGP